MDFEWISDPNFEEANFLYGIFHPHLSQDPMTNRTPVGYVDPKSHTLCHIILESNMAMGNIND